MTVIEELDALIERVKAMIPGSMAAPANKKLESRFKKSLSNYFMTLADQFPYAEIEQLLKDKIGE